MKKILSTALLALCLSGSALHAQVDANGYTTVNATMGANYANRVFFDFSANQLTSQAANNWDLAFYRNSAQDMGVRINDAQNVETYQLSNDPAAWDTITTNATVGNPMYNLDTTTRLQDGVFSQGAAGCSNPLFSFGFGCYNMSNHHIDGKVIFLLKYGNGDYYKFMITDFYGGYTFKYAKWNGTAWGATVTKTIANGTANQYFNYYSFTTNAEVPNNEPAIGSWDVMLTRYWDFYNGQMMYRLSGFLQSPNISVAKKTETQDVPPVYNTPAATDYSNVISTIGHSWKGTNAGSLVANMVYYIKEGSNYYRMYFIENGGTANGNMTFKYRNVTSLLGTNDVKAKATFGMFPNPAPNKIVTLVYDVKDSSTSKGNIQIFDMAGRKVYETEISRNQGFYEKELNLSQFAEGNYMVNMKIGDYSQTKQLILK